MGHYLDHRNFPCASSDEEATLARQLESLIASDVQDDIFRMLGAYQRILSNNRQRNQWDTIFEKLHILFCCGRNGILDGPMIGVPIAIRDSDYFRHSAEMVGRNRSSLASLEWMATCWNATFANTGLWMGKTFEPVERQTVAAKCDNDPEVLGKYDQTTTRIGRNFFREPISQGLIQSLGIPVFSKV